MNAKAILVAAGVVCGVLISSAQFVVESSTPANGAVNVPLSTAVSFTFSAPLDTNARYGDEDWRIAVLAHEPMDSLAVDSFAFSADLRTALFYVRHRAGTDYVWMISGARSGNGAPLARPYALNYTTAAAPGTRSVSGTVSFPDGDVRTVLLGLFDGAPFDDASIARVGATVLNPSGSYVLNFVRDGIYWPVAAADFNADGEIDPFNDRIGFYDPDHDNRADSIVVSGTSPSGIDIELRHLIELVTARAYLDTARAVAAALAPDRELRMIAAADTVGRNGTAFVWFYAFYSPSQDRSFSVAVSSLFVDVDSLNAPTFPPNMRAVPDNFIDSDAAMAIAEAAGGSRFRTLHGEAGQALRGGNFFWAFPQDSSAVFWYAEYTALPPDSSAERWRAYIDMLTGSLLFADPLRARDDMPPMPSDLLLRRTYPNPFNPVVHIEYSLQSAALTTAAIYDVTGRLVAELLHDAWREAGVHTLAFNSRHLPAGVYLLRIAAGRHSSTAKLVLLR